MPKNNDDYPYNTEFGEGKTPEEMKIMDMENQFHFSMRNKQIEIKMLQDRLLKLEMENAELKDMILDLGGNYEEKIL
tara:strand:- start:8 stop:238 length:231 start_codon:yes stop_codon:yes gene_type:complete